MHLKIGDRVYYWYRMNRVGKVVGFDKQAGGAWLGGVAVESPTKVIVEFEDGTREQHGVGDLMKAE